MFRSRFFVLYSPEGGGGGGGANDSAGGGNNNPPPNNPTPSKTPPSGGGAGGSNVESFYKEKIDSLHNDLSQTRATNKALGDKLNEAQAKLAGYELKEKKEGILSGIQEKLGDFEIPTDKLSKLQGLINVLPDGDDLPDRITEMVDLIKVPKGNTKPQPYSSFSGGQPAGQVPPANQPTFKPGERLTPGQIANLSPEDFARYRQSLRTQ